MTNEQYVRQWMRGGDLLAAWSEACSVAGAYLPQEVKASLGKIDADSTPDTSTILAAVGRAVDQAARIDGGRYGEEYAARSAPPRGFDIEIPYCGAAINLVWRTESHTVRLEIGSQGEMRTLEIIGPLDSNRASAAEAVLGPPTYPSQQSGGTTLVSAHRVCGAAHSPAC